MRLVRFLGFAVMPILIACTERVEDEKGARILVMGDSLMAWHKTTGKAVSHVIEKELGEPVVDRSVSAASYSYPLPITGRMGLNIPLQFQPSNWDWVVLNGGGNDLWLGCGCVLCDGMMDHLIARDGRSGAIPKLVSDIRQRGARVIYVGYMRSPGRGSLIEHCKDEGDELDARIARLAALDRGITFLSLADLVPYADASYQGFDAIHPSVKGSAEIGKRIARIIRKAR